MKIGNKTLRALSEIATGNNELSSYRSGPMLVELFNEFGADDIYGEGFPSRWKYAEDKLREINNTTNLQSLICEVFDPRNFLQTDFKIENAISHLNQFMSYDGFQVVIVNGLAKIRDSQGQSVEFDHSKTNPSKDVHIFIDEQISKSEEKIQSEDYDGAITNARSLIEAVLLDLEQNLDTNASKYDGDLPKLFKRVQKLLNLEPGRTDISGPLKQLLSGFVSIINGLSGLSNRMGDRHARSYRPSKHHAVLMVNASKTLANFLFDTNEYQQEKTS